MLTYISNSDHSTEVLSRVMHVNHLLWTGLTTSDMIWKYNY